MKKNYFLLIISLTILALVTLLFVFPNRHRLTVMEKRLKEVEEENRRLTRELDEIRQENAELKNNDPNRLYKAARDTYKYVYPEDKVYHFPEKK